MQAAFITTDPDTVAAVAEAREAHHAWGIRFHDDMAAVPGVDPDRIYWTNGILTAAKVYALAPADLDNPAPPDGWRVLQGKRGAPPRFEPKLGKAGDPARAWLAERQPPRDEALTVADHGAPTAVATPTGDGRERIHAVKVLIRAGAVHLLYERPPAPDRDAMWSAGPAVPDARWQPEPLSAWHLALEAAQAERKELAAAAAPND